MDIGQSNIRNQTCGWGLETFRRQNNKFIHNNSVKARRKNRRKSRKLQSVQPEDNAVETAPFFVYGFDDINGFTKYCSEDLRVDWKFRMLRANPRIHIDPDHEARKVSVKVSKKGTRFFQRYPARRIVPHFGSQREHDLALHRLHVDYVVKILESATAFQTITLFDINAQPIRRKHIRSILRWKWIAERELPNFSIVPDILGVRPTPMHENLHAEFRKACCLYELFNGMAQPNASIPSLNYGIIIEVINQSPPTREKWQKLVELSFKFGILVIFNILVDIDPLFSRSYFRGRTGGLVDCTFRMHRGRVYKNQELKPAYYNWSDFEHEVHRLQRSKGYVGNN